MSFAMDAASSKMLRLATSRYVPLFKAAILEMIRAQGGIVGWVGSFSALQASL
jgi:biuret amidohydrolase